MPTYPYQLHRAADDAKMPRPPVTYYNKRNHPPETITEDYPHFCMFCVLQLEAVPRVSADDETANAKLLMQFTLDALKTATPKSLMDAGWRGGMSYYQERSNE